MKKVALISSYCDTREKIDVLVNNINSLREIGLDVVLISPILLDPKIVILCDHFIYTKENPVLDWPKKAISQWMIHGPCRFHRTYADYGWAGINQVKRLGQFAINYDYDIFYHMIYDLVIDDTVKEELRKGEPGIIYPTKRGDNFWPFSLHLMSFDRRRLQLLNDLIMMESYTRFGENDAFAWLERVANVLPCVPADRSLAVEDHIDYYRDYDFFDYSPTKDFKVFFQKIDIPWRGVESTVKILFYGFNRSIDLGIQVNGKMHEYQATPYSFFDTEMLPDAISDLKLSYKNDLLDLSSAYHSIKINDIEFNSTGDFNFLA